MFEVRGECSAGPCAAAQLGAVLHSPSVLCKVPILCKCFPSLETWWRTNVEVQLTASELSSWEARGDRSHQQSTQFGVRMADSRGSEAVKGAKVWSVLRAEKDPCPGMTWLSTQN